MAALELKTKPQGHNLFATTEKYADILGGGIAGPQLQVKVQLLLLSTFEIIDTSAVCEIFKVLN